MNISTIYQKGDAKSTRDSSEVVSLNSIMLKNTAPTVQAGRAAPAASMRLQSEEATIPDENGEMHLPELDGGPDKRQFEFIRRLPLVNEFRDRVLDGTSKSKDELRNLLNSMSGGGFDFKSNNNKRDALVYVLDQIQNGTPGQYDPEVSINPSIEEPVKKLLVDVLITIDIINSDIVPNLISPTEDSGLKVEEWDE